MPGMNPWKTCWQNSNLKSKICLCQSSAMTLSNRDATILCSLSSPPKKAIDSDAAFTRLCTNLYLPSRADMLETIAL